MNSGLIKPTAMKAQFEGTCHESAITKYSFRNRVNCKSQVLRYLPMSVIIKVRRHGIWILVSKQQHCAIIFNKQAGHYTIGSHTPQP